MKQLITIIILVAAVVLLLVVTGAFYQIQETASPERGAALRPLQGSLGFVLDR